jgi:hypothetical protein
VRERVAAIVATLLLAAAHAQQWLQSDSAAPVQVRALPVTGSRPGGLGYLLVEATNASGDPHRLRVGFATERWSGGTIRTRRETELGSQEMVRWLLPLPIRPGVFVQLQVEVDGRQCMQETQANVPLGERGAAAGLFVTERPNRWTEVAAWLGEGTPSGAKPRVQTVAPGELPADWTLLSTFDAVFVDGASALGAEPQEMLRRYAAAGATVVVAGRQRLRAGPLRKGLDEHGGDWRTGLGRVAAVDDWRTGSGGIDRAAMNARTSAGCAPAQMHVQSEVPGIGRVPVRAFLGLILVFAIAAGPVNLFVVLRRRRQPLLLLVTVPVLGLGTTGAILGYGLFADGFGVQGVLRSVSVLDQEQHEVASWTARTLFAGLSPARLEVPAGVYVDCMQALAVDNGEPAGHALDYGADGSLEGGVLPARTMTTLVTCQQTTARERLRFRARTDGWDVLGDGAFAPQPGMFVLCDDRGQCFQLEAGGMRPCSRERAAQLALQMSDRLEPQSDARPSFRTSTGLVFRPGIGMADEMRARLRVAWGGDALPRGSYVGVFAAAPWLPDHGLRVHLHSASHLVFGRCAAEDFVR